MSKAFTKDDDAPAQLLVVPRAPLPAGLPNYVTPRGLQALRSERAMLERQRAAVDTPENAERALQLHWLSQRLADLDGRLASAQVVDPSTQPQDEVRFGASVRLRTESGEERVYQIVGIDEADPALGKIAFASPVARALLGRRVGECVEHRSPRTNEELQVIAIAYQHSKPE